MKKHLYIFFFILSASAFAQPPSGGPTQDPGPTGPDDIPIDGGIGLLIAAGAIYGGKKIMDRRKKQNKAD